MDVKTQYEILDAETDRLLEEMREYAAKGRRPPEETLKAFRLAQGKFESMCREKFSNREPPYEKWPRD